MKNAGRALQRIENLLIIVSFGVMVLASFAQVVNRNIFQLGIGWFEELAVYSMIWMTLLGTELGLRDGTQISVTAVQDKLKGKAKSIIILCVKALVVAFTAAITHSAYGMVLKQIQTGQTTPGLKLPMAIPYAALLVGFGIMTLVQGLSLASHILKLKNNEEKEESRA